VIALKEQLDESVEEIQTLRLKLKDREQTALQTPQEPLEELTEEDHAKNERQILLETRMKEIEEAKEKCLRRLRMICNKN